MLITLINRELSATTPRPRLTVGELVEPRLVSLVPEPVGEPNHRLSDRDGRPTLLVLEGLDRVGVSDPQGADHDDADDYGQDDDVGGDEEQR